MGKRYIMPIPLTTKKFKLDEPCTENSDLSDINFRLSKDIIVNTIVTDIHKNQWLIGKPIGRGSFGEIYTAFHYDSNQEEAVDTEYVIKIEPHSSGPLFTEINCLLRTGRITENCTPAPGVPIYIASGSHMFLNKRYRFMIIPRYRVELNYLLKRNRVSMKNILIIAVQILDILEYIHSKGFTHSDIKAQNLMIGFERQNELFENSNTSETLSALRFVHTRMCNPYRQCRSRKCSSSGEEVKVPRLIRKESLRERRKKINYQELNIEGFDDLSLPSSGDEFQIDNDYNSVFSIDNKSLENADSTNPIKERIFLIDYGLASKFIDSKGTHRMFYVDERKAHDGTLEYTSRDAHFGAHSRRSDLECLGYNLLDWTTGDLPWKEENLLSRPEIVHRMKVCFMNNIKQMLDYCYKGKYPDFLRKYLEYIGDLDYTEDPDYDYCRSIFLTEYKRLGYGQHDMTLDFSDKNQKGLDEFRYAVEKPSIQNLTANNSLPMFIIDDHVFRRYSPKNLRSKQTEVHNTSKRLRSKSLKTFTWKEILCNTAESLLQEKLEELCSPDDVASNSSNNEDSYKYEGKATYAIKLVLKSIREARNRKGKVDERKSFDFITESDGLTYAMRMVIERKNIRDDKENINRTKTTNKILQKSNSGKISKRLAKPTSKHKRKILQNNLEMKSLENDLKSNKCVKYDNIRKIAHSNTVDDLSPDIVNNVRLRSYKKRVNNLKSSKLDNKSISKKISYSKSTGTKRRADQTKR